MEPSPPREDEERFAALRREMVEQQIRRRGISDGAVLEAMARVPRHAFVDRCYLEEAYEDHPLPIGCGQTISQPFMVALMTELCDLSPGDSVLEVGAGSGYQSAVLAALCQKVYATEIVEDLVSKARRALSAAGCDNVLLELRDGSKGWPDHAPYDAILVAAGAPGVPEPLREQLAEGGRLVIPVGGRGLQILKRITRRGHVFETSADTACRFVDLRGEHGWSGSR